MILCVITWALKLARFQASLRSHALTYGHFLFCLQLSAPTLMASV